MFIFRKIIRQLGRIFFGGKKNDHMKNAAITRIPVHGSYINAYNYFRFTKDNNLPSDSQENTEETRE